MRLASVRRNGQVLAVAVADDGRAVDLHASNPLIPPTMIELLAGGDSTLDMCRAALERRTFTFAMDEPSVELLAPIPRPGKVLAIGLNYRDHALESGRDIPQRPVVFMKPGTSIIGPGSPVCVPRVSRTVDWEAELCFIVGRIAHHVPAAQAYDYVAGYMNGNDVSVREWQAHAPTWTVGKGFDTHGPTGPWIVTRDEAGDPSDWDVACYVNGTQKQSSNTRHLIFDVPALIEYLSTAMTLEPGDIVFTGTPAGVGAPTQTWLKHGDVVAVEVGPLGRLENPVSDEFTP
jgi:2-keto-4-pentenoate hydratase/2-oxohepta-3-ene-1,7-dioic acid hydratase in catechol pathway